MLSKEDCIALLRQKAEALSGERYPTRSDFTPEQVSAIKTRLGPWPRALERSGLKPPRADDRIARNREKRIRAKRARNLSRKQTALPRKNNEQQNESDSQKSKQSEVTS